MEEEGKQLSVEHSGDHHLAKVSYDEKTKKVSAGVIYSFSDNAAASLQVRDGKLEGDIIHSGDTHNLKIEISSDGFYKGSFEDSRYGNLKIVFSGGEASLQQGKIPEGGIEIDGDHHKVRFNMDNKGKISGAIESKETNYGTFRLGIDQGKITGSIVHKGEGHETKLDVSPNGNFSGSVSVGKGDTKFTFAVEKAGSEKKAFAGLKLKF